MSRIGVGIIGASVTSPGWATAVHIPAIAASEDLVLRAVSTSSEASASAAAEKFGVPGYSQADALIADPNVDLVVVAVKVTYHMPLILKALGARKRVFSEWPLGVDMSEAEMLASKAASLGVATTIGLQARFSPAIDKARELVGSGALGNILATSLTGSGMAWLDTSDAAHAYMFEGGSGASTISVPLMHALDALIYVLGDVEQVKAVSAIGRQSILLADLGTTISNTSPDHVSVNGLLKGGGVFSVLYRGGTSRAGNFRWEINGSKGDLLLTAVNGNIQVADLEIHLGSGQSASVEPIEVAADQSAFIGNVARLYQAISQDMKTGTKLAPAFDIALERHRLLAQIEASAGLSLAQSAKVA
jgi:predicted dehydrogenase